MTGLVYAILQNLVLLILAAALGWAVGFFGFRGRGKNKQQQPAEVASGPQAPPAAAMPMSPGAQAMPPAAPPAATPSLAPGSTSGPTPFPVPVAPPAGAPAQVPPPVDAPPVDAPRTDTTEDEDDSTIIRPPGADLPTATTPVVPARDAASVDAANEALGAPVATDVEGLTQQVEALQTQLRAQVDEMNRLEAGAVTAWDRTLPVLQGQIEQLEKEKNDALEQVVDLTNRLETEQARAERLQGALGDRDKRIAELTTSL